MRLLHVCHLITTDNRRCWHCWFVPSICPGLSCHSRSEKINSKCVRITIKGYNILGKKKRMHGHFFSLHSVFISAIQLYDRRFMLVKIIIVS